MYLNHICGRGTAMFPTPWSIYLKIAVNIAKAFDEGLPNKKILNYLLWGQYGSVKIPPPRLTPLKRG
jgi:hypothetical protein